MTEPDDIPDDSETLAGGFGFPPDETLDLEGPAAPAEAEEEAEDVGEQVVAGLAGLWRRAQQIQDQAMELLEAMGGMRELVLALSSEGLARREVEERLAVLEAERDVLARQLGKVRRENDEELSIARERIRSLETELSLAAERAGQLAPRAQAAAVELSEAGADIELPVVEKVGARARREALRSRPPRGRTLPPPPMNADEPSGPHAADRFRPDDLASLLDGGGPGGAAESSPTFSGLLDEPWGEPGIEVDLDADRAEAPWDLGAGPAARDEDERETPVPETAQNDQVTASLQDLLASYLDVKR